MLVFLKAPSQVFVMMFSRSMSMVVYSLGERGASLRLVVEL